MPEIYLSPSLQEGNPYIIGGSEELYMNRLADAMEPYLLANGIRFDRNDPNDTLSQTIREANSRPYALHVALHSNAAPDRLSGQLRGTDLYYAPGSANGRRFAELLAEQFRRIYPLPEKVDVLPTAALGEVTKTAAPAVLIETAYHDNPQDAAWIRDNIPTIAQAIVRAICAYFELPFLQPQAVRRGTVQTGGSSLNLRSRPSLAAPVIARIPNGATVTLYNRSGNWYVAGYEGELGFASATYIRT